MPLSRRDVLHGALLLGAAALLPGCQSGGSRPSAGAGLPGPLWPDMESPSAPVIPSPSAPVIATPAPIQGPPGIMPRAAWTSAAPKWSVSKPMNGILRITVHHDAIPSSGLTRQRDVAQRIEGIRRSHRARGSEWVDIGYHYLIDPAGRVWEGRPLRIEGAHVAATNEHNLGIVCMGNFDEQRPTSEQLSALTAFLADQMRRYRVPVSRVYTHQELKPTACPGRNLQRQMLALRSRSGPLSRA